MKNLVTGATGLLGAHLVLELLRRGDEVRALYRSEEAKKETERLFGFYSVFDLFKKIEWVVGDVMDVGSLEEAMHGVNHVYHCAAIVSYHSSDRKEMYRINVEGTANMVNVALFKGVDKFLQVSSIAALNRFQTNPVTEDGDWVESKDNTHYGITKHLSEMEVWRAGQEGLKHVILNPGFIIGPGDFTRSSASIFSKLNEGMRYYPPGGTGFIGVNDVVAAAIGLMKGAMEGERYIAVAENESMQYLFQSISKALGKSEPQKLAAPWMLQLARIAEWLKEKLMGKKALVTRETVKNASLRFYYSSEKIQKELGIAFTPIDAAIRQTANYFKQKK